MTFRPAIPEDIPKLNLISVLSKKFWGYPDEWIMRWQDALQMTQEQVAAWSILVAEKEGEPVGFCAIAEDEEQYEVMHLWLLSTHIGHGYGAQLLSRSLAAFTSGDKPIRVEADPNAEGFYRNQGFATFDRVESFPAGRYLPVMRKEVKAVS